MINNKPFSFSEMLRRTIFKGRPNFFNAKDLNKELLTIHSFVEEFNKSFGVCSDIVFTVSKFTLAPKTNLPSDGHIRSINIDWNAGKVLYKGVEFVVPLGSVLGFNVDVPVPLVTKGISDVYPAIYIVLTAKLANVTYADNQLLCGIQFDSAPNSAPSVDVEQYNNVAISLTTTPTGSNVIAILATLHPKYKNDGTYDGYGLLYNTFKNDFIKIRNGANNIQSELKTNKSLYEFIIDKLIRNTPNNVLNEVQLVRKFNLADLENAEKARHNIGLSNLVNHKQLVQEENLLDVPNIILARQNLGLGSASTTNIGFLPTETAPGNILPEGLICIWSGSPSKIPTYWVLCDGTNNTPDLRGKFVVGHNEADEKFVSSTLPRGSAVARILKANLPNYDMPYSSERKHTHETRFSVYRGTPKDDGGYDHALYNNGGNQTANNILNTHRMRSEEVTITHSGVVSLDGGGVPLSILPPYYALCYIMFIGSSSPLAPTPLPVPPPLAYPNFSTPIINLLNNTDGGYAGYSPATIGLVDEVNIGNGITITNP